MSAVLKRNLWPSTVLCLSKRSWSWIVRRSVQCCSDGNYNCKCDICFVLVNEFVHESRRDFIASTNSNTVQPQVWWKPVLSVRVKTVVRSFDQTLLSISELEIEYSPSVPAFMLRLDWKSYMQIQYLLFVWRVPFSVKLKHIALLSITNS